VNRKTVQRWLKLPGNPGVKSNGSYNVPQWLEWAKSTGVKTADSDTTSKAAAQVQQILLQNKLLQHKNDVNDSVYILAEDVEKETADLIANAKTVLLSGPSSLAPQVVGVSVQEAETLLKEWLHAALSKLQRNPLGKEVKNV
jgi:hypothetical protein